MKSNFTLTESAIQATRAFREENSEFANQNLRIFLSGKGCDGFEYGITFDHASHDDVTQSVAPDIVVICDPQAFEFVTGSVIDFVDDERGKGYLVNNPNHKKYRGKFYKRPVWQEKLNAQRQAAPPN